MQSYFRKIYLIKIKFVSAVCIMHNHYSAFEVDESSLKLEIRLRAYQAGTNTRSGTEIVFTRIWLAHSLHACSLISGITDNASTLRDPVGKLWTELNFDKIIIFNNHSESGGLGLSREVSIPRWLKTKLLTVLYSYFGLFSPFVY